MGAGILPATVHNNKLYFLFGKENKYESSAPGYSDFGGGTDNKESLFETAVREAGEELTGFLGSSQDVRKLLKKHGTYNVDYSHSEHSLYRMHIFPLKYDPMLAIYYNNNQQFIQSHLDPNVIKKSKIFEKAEIRWVCVDDILKMRPQFRSYFQNIIDIVYDEKADINKFIRTSLREKKLKTLKRRYKK
jgi:8-oxo-dGTP pyrophosphatase MutT (NUDIX family)